MTRWNFLKIFLVAAVLMLLPLQMPYMIIGKRFHEINGVLIITAFVLHNLLHFNWYKSIGKGKYPAQRMVRSIINFFLIIQTSCMLISGIAMSEFLFKELQLFKGISLHRSLHMLGAYWGFVAMNLHLGMNWTKIKKWLHKAYHPFVTAVILLPVAIYGCFVFIRSEIPSYMLLRSTFVMFDFDRPLLLHITDFISMMAFWAFLGYLLSKGLWLYQKSVFK